MVAVGVGDDDDIGLGERGVEGGGADGVAVDGDVLPLEEEGGVVDGADEDVAVCGGEVIAGESALGGWGEAVVAGGVVDGGAVAVLDGGVGSGGGGEGLPVEEVGAGFEAEGGARGGGQGDEHVAVWLAGDGGLG